MHFCIIPYFQISGIFKYFKVLIMCQELCKTFWFCINYLIYSYHNFLKYMLFLFPLSGWENRGPGRLTLSKSMAWWMGEPEHWSWRGWLLCPPRVRAARCQHPLGRLGSATYVSVTSMHWGAHRPGQCDYFLPRWIISWCSPEIHLEANRSYLQRQR